MSYELCTKKTTLPREVLKWLQSLDLPFNVKNVRRDFSNGYLVAEILSRYYPQHFSVHLYDKGSSLSAKQWNWSQIKKSSQKLHLHLMKEVVEGSIHCKPGAAEQLVQEIYRFLTNKSPVGAREVQGPDLDFTDREYQDLLPTLARSTASTAIKKNLTTTEIMAEPDISTNQRKAEIILQRHLQHSAAQRLLNPGRFKAKPNVSRLAAESSSCGGSSSGDKTLSTEPCSSSTQRGAAVPYKEITVRQPVRHSLLDH